MSADHGLRPTVGPSSKEATSSLLFLHTLYTSISRIPEFTHNRLKCTWTVGFQRHKGKMSSLCPWGAALQMPKPNNNNNKKKTEKVVWFFKLQISTKTIKLGPEMDNYKGNEGKFSSEWGWVHVLRTGWKARGVYSSLSKILLKWPRNWHSWVEAWALTPAEWSWLISGYLPSRIITSPLTGWDNYRKKQRGKCLSECPEHSCG